jgi:Uma2 family endonuclease
LIDGYIVWREDMKPSHVLVTERLKRRIETLLPSGWFVREDKPVRIPDHDEPRPDVAVVRGDPELYAARHPGPSDVALLIEVSDSSLSRDRAEKMIIYARSGIPNYWIANLIDRQIEIYADPQLSGYASRLDLKVGETAPVSIDGIQVGTIAVADLLR